MWRSILDLLTAAHRPLVVFDFETAGLGGAPPVEFAVLIFQPWDEPEQDAITRKAAAECPPGLTYACVRRLNPGVPISPGAARVHKIADADVRKATPYQHPEVVGFFNGLASGDEDTGLAVWCGHNAAGADVPWARRWGYLPDDTLAGLGGEIDIIDTMRIMRRLTRSHPGPIVPDMTTPFPDEQSAHVPAFAYGLDAYASSLTGTHVALTGKRHDGHGALADVCATARCLARMVDLWATLLPSRRADVPASVNLAALLAALDAPPPGEVSWDGWLGEREDGVPGYVWRKGKHRGEPAHRDAWVTRLPRQPTGVDGQGWCSQHTADILAGLPALTVAR